MCEPKFSYEQFCTYCDKNIIIEEVIHADGVRVKICTNTKCPHNDNDCKNKLRQKN